MVELGTDGPNVIIAGVDGSRTSMRAGAYAAAWRAARDLASWSFTSPPPGALATLVPAGVVLAEEALDQVAQDLRTQVEQAARERGLSVRFVAARGDPFSELCRIATEVRADAIVVGASAMRRPTRTQPVGMRGVASRTDVVQCPPSPAWPGSGLAGEPGRLV